MSVSSVSSVTAMAKDPLAEAGFYFDELNKLRVLEPDVSQKTSELKEECKEFVDSKHFRLCSQKRDFFSLSSFHSSAQNDVILCSFLYSMNKRCYVCISAPNSCCCLWFCNVTTLVVALKL